MEMSECVFSCHFGKHDPLSHSNGSAPVLSKPIFSSFHIAKSQFVCFWNNGSLRRDLWLSQEFRTQKTSWCFIIKTSWRSYVLSSSPFLNGFVWKLGTPKNLMIITIPIKPDHLYTRSSEDGLGILGFQKLLGRPPLRWIWKATSHTGRYAAGLKIGDSCHDGFWWFMMVYEELSWFMKNYDGLWKIMMVYDGLSWFMGLKISFLQHPKSCKSFAFSSEIEKLKPWVFTFNTSPWYGGFHKWWMVYHGKSHKMDENWGTPMTSETST